MMGRRSTLAYGNMFVGTVLGVVAAYFIGHYMGTVPLGQMTAAMGFLGVLFFVTDLGMGQAHIKRVSEGRDPGDCFATFAVFKAFATLTFVVLGLGGILVYNVILGKPFESTTLTILLVIMGYYVAKSLQEIGQSSFDARLETARSQLAAFMDTLVRASLSVLAALAYGGLVLGVGPLAGRVPAWLEWIGDEPGLALALATAAGAVAASAAALVMLARALERGRFRWDLLKDYSTFALPLFLASAAGMISQNIDAAVLAFFLDERETGVFGGIRRILGLLTGIAAPISVLLFARMSQLVSSGDREGVQRTMDRSLRYLSMLIVPICAFTAAFAEIIIRLFLGAEFTSGAPALAVFALYVIVFSLGVPHINLVLGMGRSDLAGKIGLATAGAIIAVNLLLVPNDIRSLGIRLAGLGVLGSALATLTAGLVYYGGARYATQRHYGYRERSHVGRHLLAAAVMVAALWAVHAWVFPFERWYAGILYVPLGAAVYGLALLAMREITREDVRFLRESVHPGELLRYAWAELKHRRR